MPVESPYLDQRERTFAQEVLCHGQVAYVATGEKNAVTQTTVPYVVPMNFSYEPPTAANNKPAPNTPTAVANRPTL